MQLNPYVFFNGQCEAAFAFYQRCLGGKITAMSKFAGSPAEKTVPPEWAGKILHARLEVGAWIVMGSDPPPGHYQTPAGMSLSLLLTDYEQAEKIFHALAENGAIRMPFQKPFWSKGYGQLIDQFQVPWMINVD